MARFTKCGFGSCKKYLRPASTTNYILRLDSCFCKRWEALLANTMTGMEHDIVFFVGEGRKRISAHKFVLSAISPVFQAMFSENFSGSAESNQEIEIPDVEYQAFENLIKYAYTGSLVTLDLSIEDALSTMYAANKYDISDLMEPCSDMLYSNISIDNAVTIYQSASLLGDSKLMEKASEFLVSNFSEVINSAELLQFSSETLCFFFAMDKIGMTSELHLFNAAIRWGTHICTQKEIVASPENLKQILCDVIKNIRFPTMSAMDFTTNVESTGVLNKNDCYNVYKYFSLSEKDRLKMPNVFSITPRKKLLVIMLWDKDVGVLRTIPTSKAPKPGTFDFNSVFSVDNGRFYQENLHVHFSKIPKQSIYLRAIGFVGPAVTENKKIKLSVKLANFSSGDMVALADTIVELTPKSEELYYAVFENPIKLTKLSAKGLNFALEYLEGTPTILSDYGTIMTATEEIHPQSVSVRHSYGNRIIAAMQFILK